MTYLYLRSAGSVFGWLTLVRAAAANGSFKLRVLPHKDAGLAEAVRTHCAGDPGSHLYVPGARSGSLSTQSPSRNPYSS